MITMRIATAEDAAALAEIYAYYVDNTTISFEYTAPTEKEFGERIAHKLEAYPFIVAEWDGRIIGYAYASRLRERVAYDWDAELSVYIHRENCSLGLGTRLYTALLALLRLQNVATVYGAITDPNPPSFALHEKLGFVYAGRFSASGYKHGQWLDVVWYEKRMTDRTAPKPFIPFPQLEPAHVREILMNH